MNPAIEDIRSSICDDSLAALVRTANDYLDAKLGTLLEPSGDPKLTDVAVCELPVATAEIGHPFEAKYGRDDDAAATSISVSDDLLEIHWPIDNSYCTGGVASVATSGQHVIFYDDCDTETLNLACEAWRFCAAEISSIPRTHSPTSDVPAVLSDMLAHFGKKPFMLHQAQVLPPYATAND